MTPQGVTRTGPDRVDSAGPCSPIEGRSQHGTRCGPQATLYLVRSEFSCMILRGMFPSMRVPRSTTDTSYPVGDIAPLFIRLSFILTKDGFVASSGG